MGKHLVPVTMIAAMAGFAVAALTVGFVPGHPLWWRAAISLAVLGGIAPMIYAVNIRIVPVFGRRSWRNLALLRAQVILLLAGAWIVFAGRVAPSKPAISIGSLLALASGLLFIVNLARLFKQPATAPSPPTPSPIQTEIDRLAVKFTRWSGIYLQVGLIVGVITSFWTPATGRWDLVWAHAMLVGFMLTMVSGTCYHVLSRWTGHPWRSVMAIRIHLIVTILGFPFMLLALATNWTALFAVAGPLQAAALILFLVNIAPLAARLPGNSKFAVLAASLCLAVGVILGAWFANDAVAGARLRMTHAEINLFGWTGLLISGIATYLVPRFAGQPLRWPRLAAAQLGLLGAGVLTGAVALAFRGYGHPNPTVVLVAQALVAAGFVSLGVIIAGTFYAKKSKSPATVSSIPIAKRRTAAPLPIRPSR
jgi:hypothetical protein